MTRDELKRALLEEVANIAPEIDPATVPDDADLRDALDIDSISFLNLIIAIKLRFGVDVPELDYPKLRSLRGVMDYLAERIQHS
ncbi:MAG: acyl carrier protein [Alphaproteobacteria bacterium]